nr:MAG TPA: hypothetical protein [Caudoviricetes sp.]
MSRELPILFNTEMVRAILAGQKTCTRRLPNKRVREEYFEYDDWANTVGGSGIKKLSEKEFYEQYSPYQPGDILYVRETWGEGYEDGTYIYKASDKLANHPMCKESSKLLYHPSIHMPKEAARIWLRVVGVQLERLQDITENGAKAEGAIDNRGFIHSPENEYNRIHTAREHFAEIWNSTIKKSDIDRYGWKDNPWVWVIEFERCDKEGRVVDGR